jgi:hypothetical protein
MSRCWILFSLFLLALSGPVGAAGPAVDPVWVEPRVYQAAKASRFSALKSEQSRHHGAQIRLAPMAPGDIEKRLQARSQGPNESGFGGRWRTWLPSARHSGRWIGPAVRMGGLWGMYR